jgi:hypothetical protein
MIEEKLECVEYLNCLGCMITSDARCTREIKSRLPWQKHNSTGRGYFSPAN